MGPKENHALPQAPRSTRAESLPDPLLDQVPGLESACFSILAPGTQSAPHRGVYKGLINCHLGVIIPKQAEKCRMQIGEETVVWQPGQS